MSFQAMAWAVKIENIKPAQKLVLLMLSNYASNEEGYCYPAVKTLSKNCNMHETSVRKCLHELKKIGIITIIERKNGTASLSNVYKINFEYRGITPQQSTGTPLVDYQYPPSHTLVESISYTISDTTTNSLRSLVGAPDLDHDYDYSIQEQTTFSGDNVLNGSNTISADSNRSKNSISSKNPQKRSPLNDKSSGEDNIPQDTTKSNGGTLNSRQNASTKKEKMNISEIRQELLSLGCDEVKLDYWLEIRKNKRLTITNNALRMMESQAAKVGLTLVQAIEYCATAGRNGGWAAFNAEYYLNATRPSRMGNTKSCVADGKSYTNGPEDMAAWEASRTLKIVDADDDISF